jgi:hypothetical protein
MFCVPIALRVGAGHALKLANKRYNLRTMVAVAQLVESRIVIPVVVGSSPISHPKYKKACNESCRLFFLQSLS